jgi:HSP20 family molecular chaperone IbpA
MYTTYYVNSQITDSVTQAGDGQYVSLSSSSLTMPPWPCSTYQIAATVFQGETESGHKLIVNVAGCSKENVSVKYIIEDKKINIAASIDTDDFKRDYSASYFVPSKFDLDEMKCSLKNGLLTIEVPFKKNAIPKQAKIS